MANPRRRIERQTSSDPLNGEMLVVAVLVAPRCRVLPGLCVAAGHGEGEGRRGKRERGGHQSRD